MKRPDAGKLQEAFAVAVNGGKGRHRPKTYERAFVDVNAVNGANE
jgi:hypothetical protein